MADTEQRARFEAWAKSRHLISSSGKISPSGQIAWDAWDAALASQAPDDVRRDADALVNPNDCSAGPEGEWYCEKHPDALQGHGGCEGAGIPACARLVLALHWLRLSRQQVRELHAQYSFLAEAAIARQVQVPDGFVLVPREPTDDMLDKANSEKVGGNCYFCSQEYASYSDATRVWAAMLAAAPAQEGR